MIVKNKSRKDNFFIMGNEPIQNPDLSWAAKGLLAYLLSLPDSWEIHARDLFSRSASKRNTTEAAIKELITAGHIVKEVGKDYRRHTKFTVYEVPKKHKEGESF